MQKMTEDGKKSAFHGKEFNIYDLAASGALDELQEKLSLVSGMAFLTVDFRGEPVTKPAGFTEFCAYRRKYGCYGRTCSLSNAFGGAAAAISNEPYYFLCPSGMMHIAVSIVINEQYLGTLIGGQVRCPDASGVDDFSSKLSDEMDWKQEPKLLSAFSHIPVMEFEKVKQVAELAALYVKQFCEREDILLEKEKYEQKKTHLQEKEKMIHEQEKKMERMFMEQGKEKTASHFTLNILNYVAGLACIEDAEQTEEMVHLLIQILHYQRKKEDVPVYLKEELEQVEAYLKIQKLRFEDKMTYEIVKGERLEEQMILPGILLPFVENAVNYGVLSRKKKGRIRILCYTEHGDCIITIEDEGSGFTVGQMSKVYEHLQGYEENYRVSSDIYEVRKRLMEKYGEKYDVQLSHNGEEGTSVIIRIPQSVERIRYHV